MRDPQVKVATHSTKCVWIAYCRPVANSTSTHRPIAYRLYAFLWRLELMHKLQARTVVVDGLGKHILSCTTVEGLTDVAELNLFIC